MRAERYEGGGTHVVSRLRGLDQRSTTRWGTPAIGYYTSGDSQASCVVDAGATPRRVVGGADFIGLVAKPLAHELRLFFSGLSSESRYGLVVRLTTANGDTTVVRRTVMSDDSANGDITLTGLRRLEKFTRIAFSAVDPKRPDDQMWTVVARG